MPQNKWHFSLARAETGARGKLSYGGRRAETNAPLVLLFPDISYHRRGVLDIRGRRDFSRVDPSTPGEAPL